MKHIFYVPQITIALATFLVAPCIAIDGQAGSSRPAAQGQPEQVSSNDNQVPNNRVPSLQTLALAKAAQVIQDTELERLERSIEDSASPLGPLTENEDRLMERHKASDPALTNEERDWAYEHSRGGPWGPLVDLVKLKKALAKKEWDKEFYLLSPEILEAYFLSLGFTPQDKSDIAPLFWNRYQELFPKLGVVEIAEKMMKVGMKWGDKTDLLRSRPNYIFAAAYGLLGECKLCAHFGMDMERQDSAGRTPLMLAAVRGNEAVARFLIEKGAHINEKQEIGEGHLFWTPLMFAASTYNEGCVRLLIANGAHINEQDARGSTALDLARNVLRDFNKHARFSSMAAEDRMAHQRRCEAIVQMLEQAVQQQAQASQETNQ